MAEPEESVGELLARLIDDGKGLVRAEISYYYTVFRARLRDLRASLWMGAAAVALSLSASVALIVGLVLTLSPLVGPAGATAIVVVSSGGLAALLARLAWLQIKRAIGDKG